MCVTCEEPDVRGRARGVGYRWSEPGATLTATCFTQVSGFDYHDAYLYAPVVRLETFCDSLRTEGT